MARTETLFTVLTELQVLMPLVQGMAWTLIVAGYLHLLPSTNRFARS